MGSTTPTGGDAHVTMRRAAWSGPLVPRSTAAMVTVADYQVSRGGFLPGPPLLSVVPSFFGVVPTPMSSDWASLAEPGWSLFAAADAGMSWSASGAGDPMTLSGTSDAVAEIIPGLPADEASGKRFVVARLARGAALSTPVRVGRTWVVLVLRPLPSRDPGPVLTLSAGNFEATVLDRGGVWQVIVGDAVAATFPRHASGTEATVIGLDITGVRSIVAIREGTAVYTKSWTVAEDDALVVTGVTLGGLGSAEMLVYALAVGHDDQMPEVMAAMSGFCS